MLNIMFTIPNGLQVLLQALDDANRFISEFLILTKTFKLQSFYVLPRKTASTKHKHRWIKNNAKSAAPKKINSDKIYSATGERYQITSFQSNSTSLEFISRMRIHHFTCTKCLDEDWMQWFCPQPFLSPMEWKWAITSIDKPQDFLKNLLEDARQFNPRKSLRKYLIRVQVFQLMKICNCNI